MAQEKIEEFSTERLKKRKNLVLIVLVLLIAAVVLDGAAFIYDLISGNGFSFYLFLPVIVCFFFVIIMYKGLKKIKEELTKRKDN